MRREYEMTQADMDDILNASKPVIYLVVGGRPPRSPQQNANDAWAALGRKMHFHWETVEPLPSKGPRFFTAEAKEASDA